MSFFRKNRKKKEQTKNDLISEESIPVPSLARLNVDVFQASDSIIVYAQVAGANMSSIDVSVEGEADILIIRGKRLRPEHLIAQVEKDGDFCTEECVWGNFKRKIFLPARVDVDQAQAKLKDGILILSLPLLFD